MMKKIKNITSLVNENKKEILRKVVILGGLTIGLVGGALLVRSSDEVDVEVVEEETIEIIVP